MALLKIGVAVASAVERSKSAARSIAIPTLRVVSNLLHLVKLGVASDVSALREDLLRSSRAEASKKDAEARQNLAAAIEAENRSRFSEQRSQLEVRLQRAEIAKAEAEARRYEAVARMAEAQASKLERILEKPNEGPNQESVDDAAARLKTALRRLNAKGGHLLVDVNELKALERELAPAPNSGQSAAPSDVAEPQERT